MNPKDMALVELSQYTDAKIAVLLGVPPPLVGLPTAGDSLTYNTVLMALEQHWRLGLRPSATAVMAGLSRMAAAPRDHRGAERRRLRPAGAEGQGGDSRDLQRDRRPGHRPVGAVSVDEIREAERLEDTLTAPSRRRWPGRCWRHERTARRRPALPRLAPSPGSASRNA